MKNTVSIIRKELKSFLGSNRINTKHLFAKGKYFQNTFEFPVSGRTVYRIVSQNKKPTLKNQKKILDRLDIEYKEEFNNIQVVNYGKE